MEFEVIAQTFFAFFENFIDFSNEAPESIPGKFRQISVTLNNILPEVSDEILFEIDDILYDDDDDDDDDVTGTNNSSNNLLEPSAVLNDESMFFYLELYERLLNRNLLPRSRIVEWAYLKLINYMPIRLHDEKEYALYILNSIVFLTETRKVENICFSMKIAKLCIISKGIDRKRWLEMSFKKNYAFIWMSNLVNIPEATYPQQKRVTSWIRKIAIATYGKSDWKSLIFNENLKNYFNAFDSSKEDEDQKLQRLRDFIPGYGWMGYGKLRIMKELHINFVYLLWKTKKDDDKLRKMERLYGFEIKPYLLSVDNSNPYISDIEDVLKNKETSIPTNDTDALHEPDYTAEQFIFYEEFVKKMQILDIVYTACITCLQEANGWDSRFFTSDSFLKTHLRDALSDPSKRGYIPWILEILIKKFPFMIFSKRNQYLLKDLVKMLNGEYVDKLIEEEIHYAINSYTVIL